MRKTFALSLLLATLGACNGKEGSTRSLQAVTCEPGQTLVYTNRFAPQAGGSGIATGEDAANGAINSEPSPGFSEGGGISEDDALRPLSEPLPDPTTNPRPEPLSAMTTSCVAASPCEPGKVAVEMPPMVNNNVGIGGPSVGPTEGDLIDAEPSPLPAPPTPPTPPDTPNVMLPPPGTLLCVDPPPACPDGQSPQWSNRGEWECTDCALVVTYGGAYGNYRRCVNEPHVDCPDGEVPTWIFESDQWECAKTCDNGQYDQHTIEGELICVPC